jgi:hypothetical protein
MTSRVLFNTKDSEWPYSVEIMTAGWELSSSGFKSSVWTEARRFNDIVLAEKYAIAVSGGKEPVDEKGQIVLMQFEAKK